jgi:BMFP domain-containing protein YqiC
MSAYFKSANANTPTKEIIHQLVLAAINKLNLVTREEFTIQTQVLLRTRLKVEQLERKLMELSTKQHNSN